jgi:hypothetical protein
LEAGLQIEAAVTALKKIAARLEDRKDWKYDNEPAHADADQVLTDLLNQLGYNNVVEAYDAIGKWYG